MDRLQIAVLILLFAGALMPAFCILKMRMIKRFLKTAVVTDAVVVKSEKRTGLKGSVYYVLSIQYQDSTGRSFTGTAIGSKKSSLGSIVPVMYKSADPTKYKTDFGKYLPWLLGFSLVLFAFLVWFCYWLLDTSYRVDPT